MPKRYAELLPDEVSDLLAQGAIVVWPWGALEWHGAHLPLGLDGIVAEAFAERLAERVAGLLLPTCWLPMTTLPHPLSLQVSTDTMRGIVRDTLGSLAKAGVTRLAIVTGHYAQGHEIELYHAAIEEIERENGIAVFAGAPLELLGDEFLDHAARYETSQLLAIRPELVALQGLPAELQPKTHAVLGSHPSLGSATEGERLLQEALEAWSAWLDSDKLALRFHYLTAIERYKPYVERHYRGSWEEAILSWWLER